MTPIELIRRAGLIIGLPLAAAGLTERAHGDVFELTNGGRIEGRLIESGDDSAVFVIETATGRVTVARAQVARVDATSEVEKEYEATARSSPDTVEAHWKLYEWCRDHKLREQAQKHLTRILELDPDHADARAILGFRKLGDQWQTRDEVMASRGMVKYDDGQYYTRQHVELLEQQKAAKATHVDWRKDLDRMRRRLIGRYPDQAQQARAEIQAIRDPLAAEPLVAILRRETDPALQRLWLEVASRLDHPAAVATLIEHSLSDPNEDIRYQCLEYLVASGRPGLATPYVRALGSTNNVTINRAAVALGQIRDPDAIAPLIEALVTTHKVETNDDPGQMAVSMSPGGGGMAMGAPPKPKPRPVRNPSALNALVTLTGIPGFEYNQAAWRAWFVERAKSQRIDLRRDF